MGEIISYLFDFLLPPRRTEQLVRTLTLEHLYALSEENGLPYHDPRVTALIWELKYHGTRRSMALAGEYISETLLAFASEEVGKPLLIPVPMHPARRRERGHNQTELLCQAALPYVGNGLAYAPAALRRVRTTPPQQGLSKHERLTNVARSMEARPNVVSGRVCLVVDDVSTTGATLGEAKRALLEAGARSVQLVSLAHS